MQNNPPIDSDAPTWPAHAPPSPSPQPYPRPYPPAYAQPQPYPQPRPLPMQTPPPPRAPRRSTVQADRIGQALIQLISLALAILESLLLVRIVLLLAASPDAGFSRFVYSVTAQFVAPFQGVFPNSLSLGGATLDEAAILAMIVYALAARLLKMAVRMIAHL